MSTSAIPDIKVSSKDIDIGDIAEITITTKDSSDTLADPTTLVVQVQPTGGTATSYTFGSSSFLTKTSTGVYRLLHTVTSAYRHQVRAVTTGEAGAEPGYFDVRPNNIT